MNNAIHEPTNEKARSGAARFMLVLGAAAVMLSFYVASLTFILLLAALIAFELCMFLVAVRFGAFRFVIPYLHSHTGLLVLLLKSFWLRKGVDYRIALQPGDAPALFVILDRLCGQLDLMPPQEVLLELSDGAWVRLKGLRQGAGKTTLGVGYDLLAGLTVREVEAVLAHEMTHAKLIQRGFRNWLGFGQARINNLAMGLWAQVNAARQAKQSVWVAKFLFSSMNRLLRLSTRLTAAYSRQHEFEADRGAAQLCGAAAMKSALLKVDALHKITSRLPWNERVAQLQQTEGYSRWLLEEIAQGSAKPAVNSTTEWFNKYSTHPLLRDRLAALPPEETALPPGRSSALALLAHPDELARKLVTELQRLIAENEKKDSRNLERNSRKTRQTRLTPWQVVGVVVGLPGIIGVLTGLAVPNRAGIELCSLLVITAAAICFRLGRYRDRIDLPVPPYEKLVKPPADPLTREKIAEKEKLIAAEIMKLCKGYRKAAAVRLLNREAYSALEACDYLRAHVAARECLQRDKKCVEAALALAIAKTTFRQIPEVVKLIHFVGTGTGFKTFSTSWGTAWASLLAADWLYAEIMLERALKLRPRQATLAGLLAIAQTRRGKHQSAISNARLACDLCPASRELAKYLIARLLDAGYTREARERLEPLKEDWETDPDLMFALAQLHLLERQFGPAQEWSNRVRKAGDSAQMLVRLGGLYENARRQDDAATLYQEALASGHYPEAHLGLGRLEYGRADHAAARPHVLAALNMERALGKEGLGTWQILQPILNQMLWLQDPIPVCRAWIATFAVDFEFGVLSGKSFMVYAPELTQAQEHFQVMLNAFQPEKPTLTLSQTQWTAAPRPMQPDGPVRPGVQGIWH